MGCKNRKPWTGMKKELCSTGASGLMIKRIRLDDQEDPMVNLSGDATAMMMWFISREVLGYAGRLLHQNLWQPAEGRMWRTRGRILMIGKN